MAFGCAAVRDRGDAGHSQTGADSRYRRVENQCLRCTRADPIYPFGTWLLNVSEFTG